MSMGFLSCKEAYNGHLTRFDMGSGPYTIYKMVRLYPSNLLRRGDVRGLLIYHLSAASTPPVKTANSKSEFQPTPRAALEENKPLEIFINNPSCYLGKKIDKNP